MRRSWAGSRSGFVALGSLLAAACASSTPPERLVSEDPRPVPAVAHRAAPGPTSGGHPALCRGRVIDVTAPVNAISADFEAQRLAYDRSRMQDCSGMLHQVLGRFRDDFCPEAAGQLPVPAAHRSSDAIAGYYARRGLLTVVDSGSELEHAEALRPGAIVFYGRRGERFAGLSPAGAARVVTHVGVVTSVVRGPRGVESYAIFHGRRVGRPAAITNYHVREPRRSGSPPFGNGRQPWVGWAPIVAPPR